MNVENKLNELNIQLPKVPDPVGSYVDFKKINNLLFISCQLLISNDRKTMKYLKQPKLIKILVGLFKVLIIKLKFVSYSECTVRRCRISLRSISSSYISAQTSHLNIIKRS